MKIERNLTEVQAIIAAYQGGLSYEGVARDFDTSSTRVQAIMRKHSPGSIRQRGTPGFTTGPPLGSKPPEAGFTLKSLGLRHVGACVGCGVRIVSETEGRRQRCPLCVAFNPKGRAA